MVCSKHLAVGRQRAVGHLEEMVVALVAEVLERADRDDAVDGLVKFLPSLQQHSSGAGGVHLVEHFLDMTGLVLRQRQAHDIDVVFLDGAPHGRAPAAADVQQRHPGFEVQLAQGQVDLGDLGLLQRHVVAFEVGTAVGLGGVQEQPEKVVGEVVMSLHVSKMRRELHGHTD